MNLVIHFFKKDFRRTRLFFGVWVLLLLAHAAIMAIGLQPGMVLSPSLDSALGDVGPKIEALVLAVLVALLVQEEPPAGSTGFWLTRPMPKGKVVTTKALYGLIFLAVAAGIMLFVLAYGKVSPGDLAKAALEVAFRQLQTIVIAGLLAAVTTSFGRFVIAGAIYFAATYLIELAANTVASRELVWGTPEMADYGAILNSRTIVAGAIICLGITGALVYQYQTRRSFRTVLAAVIVQILAIVSAHAWPINFFPRPAVAVTALALPTLRATIEETSAGDAYNAGRGSVPSINLSAQYLLDGVPSEYAALQRSVTAHLRSTDGVSIPVRPPRFIRFEREIPNPALEAALGRAYIYGSSSWGGPTEGGLLNLSADDFRRYGQQQMQLTARVGFTLQRIQVTARVPLAPGSHIDDGSKHFYITRILREGRGLTVIVQVRRLSVLFGRPPLQVGEIEGISGWRGMLDGKMYVLVNPRTHEVIRAGFNGADSLGTSRGMAPVLVENAALKFGSATDGSYDPTPILDEAWSRDAQLVQLQPVRVGAIEVPIEEPGFVPAGPNRNVAERAHRMPMNRDWLTRFHLSPSPSPKELAKYIDDVATAAAYWYELDRDLPVAMLSMVGPGHVDLLLAKFDSLDQTRESEALVMAAIRTAGPGDRDAVISALPKHSELASLVTKFGWQRQARPVLLQGLADKDRTALPKDWILAIASLRDPSTYPALKQFLVRTRSRQMTYNAIRKLPGIDLRETVDQSWKAAQTEPEAVKFDAAKMAVDLGYADALAVLVDVLRRDDRGQPQQLEQATTLVSRYLPIEGDQQELVSWYDAHKSRLHFDPEQKKFVTSGAP